MCSCKGRVIIFFFGQKKDFFFFFFFFFLLTNPGAHQGVSITSRLSNSVPSDSDIYIYIHGHVGISNSCGRHQQYLQC